ncbi:MAG: hypothetical protein K2M12_09780 [Muribaculaceae bacterium]|nr:hypothetical protein [Muribaculaceae bacterium]
MKNLLFPRQFQVVGWLLFVPAIFLGIYSYYFTPLTGTGALEIILNDAAIIGTTAGAIFIVCSKEKHEDEMIRSIRLASLLKALYVYAAILILSVLFINGGYFLVFMIFNLVLLPLIYVVVFRLEIYRYNKMCEDEE